MLSSQIELFRRYHRHPSPELRNQLIELNRKLAYNCAHKYARVSSEPVEDLLQESLLALTIAVEKFNPYKGTAFSSLAVPTIEGRLKNYLSRKAQIIKWPRKTYESAQRIRKLEKQLTVSLGRCPKPSELAKAMDITVEQLKQIQEDLRNCRFPAPEENASFKPDRETAIAIAVQIDLSHVGEIEQEAFDLLFEDCLPIAEAAQRLNCSVPELSVRLKNFYRQVQLKAS